MNLACDRDALSKGIGYYNPSLMTETQVPVNLEMASYRSQLSKEDFGIITTTQAGILNTLNIMSSEMSMHTSVILKQDLGNEQVYIDIGPVSPDCPKKKKKQDSSKNHFISSNDRHWMNDCQKKNRKAK